MSPSPHDTNSISTPENEDLMDKDLLSNCVHCGFCLEVCPTYQLTGDENNSPRGRLRLWRQEAEGKLPYDQWTDFYTSECVGCLACESACPANVPYGEILEYVRREHVQANRARPGWLLSIGAALAKRPSLFNASMTPARLLRRLGMFPGKFVFSGSPAITQSTASYVRQLMKRHQPTGRRVALLTGCLMESLFREINFATARVLVENNVQVSVPGTQGCCGALHEHTGLSGSTELRSNNETAFGNLDVDAVVSNSSGCGLALAKTLSDGPPVLDVLEFLGEIGPVSRRRESESARVYVDLPCHLIHGKQLGGIPENVLNATGYHWEFAPQARDCCGSGGTYNLQKPENSREILNRKAAFLDDAHGDPVIVATSNHVCMMQWNSARTSGVRKPFEVRHVIQLLDPGE